MSAQRPIANGDQSLQPPTADQLAAIISALINNVDWKKVNFPPLQTNIISSPETAGILFTIFLQNMSSAVGHDCFPFWAMTKLMSNTDWSFLDEKDFGIQHWLHMHPKEAAHRFRQFIQRHGLDVPNPFPVYKTVELGQGPRTTKGLLKAIRAKGYNLNTLLKPMEFDALNLPIQNERESLNLYVVRFEELGFPDGSTFPLVKILSAAKKKFDLDPCPPEVALRLRTLIPKEDGELSLTLAMELFKDGQGRFWQFGISNKYGGSAYFDCYQSSSEEESYFLPYSKFVFCRRRS